MLLLIFLNVISQCCQHHNFIHAVLLLVWRQKYQKPTRLGIVEIFKYKPIRFQSYSTSNKIDKTFPSFQNVAVFDIQCNRHIVVVPKKYLFSIPCHRHRFLKTRTNKTELFTWLDVRNVFFFVIWVNQPFNHNDYMVWNGLSNIILCN